MDNIRRLEKLSQTELSSLVLKLELRGFKEVDVREARSLPAKRYFRQRVDALVPDADETEYWLVVWSEPLVE